MGYWEQRQAQLQAQLEREEEALKRRLAAFYERERRRLEKEIAAFYHAYGKGEVLEYRALLEALSDADRRLLFENMEEFAQKYPTYAHLLPVRESVYKLNRLEGLQYSILLEQYNLGALEQEELAAHLAALAERGYQAAAEALHGAGFGGINPDVVRAIVDKAWADGANFSQKIWKNRRRLADYLSREFSAAVARGDAYRRIISHMTQQFSYVSRRDMYRLIYTEGTYVLNESTIRPFEQDFEFYRVSTVGDGKVCDICAGTQGQEYPIRGRIPGVNFPPFHPWCRCTFTVVIPEDFLTRSPNAKIQGA